MNVFGNDIDTFIDRGIQMNAPITLISPFLKKLKMGKNISKLYSIQLI